MVSNGDSNITNHINQSQYSSHHKERMVQFLWNLEFFLVPASDVDGRGTAKQSIE